MRVRTNVSTIPASQLRAGLPARDLRKLTAIYCAATNDANGNPRRFWRVVDRTAETVAVVDEGYAGRGALHERFPNALETVRIDVTPGEYRAAMREGPNN